MSIDAHGYPIGFKVAEGRGRGDLLAGGAGAATLVAEVRQVSHQAKEAVVEEGAGGPVWRVASDEGTHLKGTDLAPFPLGFFNAGLQADLAGAIAGLARARGIPLQALEMRLVTAYSLTGSFAQGTGRGVAEGVHVDIDIDAPAGGAELTALVADAVAASPAMGLTRLRAENSFALYQNGRRLDPTTLPASTAPNATDPFLKYATAPAPMPGSAELPDAIVKTGEKQPGEPLLDAPASGRVIREVVGRGRLTDPRGTYRASTALNLPGSSIFAFTCDATAAADAPSGLALATAGIAFCYMTQICRYIESMKLPIRGIRLVQMSPFMRDSEGRGAAGACDTHLFLNGEADVEIFEMLQRVAANTCYLHQTMINGTQLKLRLRQGGKVIWHEGT